MADDSATGSPSGLTGLTINDTTYRTRLTRKFRGRKAWAPPDPRRVEAFIPGAIREVFVAPGQRIARGAPLLVLEAMKMQNTVGAPSDLTVTRVHVAPGAVVAKGQLLLEVEPDPAR